MWNLPVNTKGPKISLELRVKFTFPVTHTWTDLFYWNKIDHLVGDNLRKFLLVRKPQNNYTHAVIKKLQMNFTRFGRPFMLRSDYGCWYASKQFQNSSTCIGFSTLHLHLTFNRAEVMVGITKKLMKKKHKGGKTMEFWFDRLQYWLHKCLVPFHHHWQCWWIESWEPPFHNFHQW